MSQNAGVIVDELMMNSTDEASDVRLADHQLGHTSTISRIRDVALVPLQHRNWMIHAYFVRQNFNKCQTLIKQHMNMTGGLSEHALHVQALMLRSEGKLQQSLETFQRCIQLDPDNVHNLKQLAKSLFLLGKYSKALSVYEQLERNSACSADWEISYNKGLCCVRLENSKCASDNITRALSLHPHQQAYRELARIAEHQQDLPAAVNILQQATRQFSDDPELAAHLGHMLLSRGEYETAFEQFSVALAYQPLHEAASLGSAAIIQDHGDYELALARYRAVSGRTSDSAALWNNVAMCFFGKKKYVVALSCLKRACSLDPCDWHVHYNLAVLLVAMKQYASAFHHAAAALNHHVSPGVYCLLALILDRLGDHNNAEKAYLAALSAVPVEMTDERASIVARVTALVNHAALSYTVGKYDAVARSLTQLDSQMALATSSDVKIDQEVVNLATQLRDLMFDSQY